ncbi:hypothetical protein ACLQ2R_04950 [Streptosporangium sp. DT93]|uniref:hypothetical protein n=1 Tax=Streptosporangium sp. DT93 TaxID=3393428 RepID=UPI003CED5939
MSEHHIAADPAALGQIGLTLRAAAAALPRSGEAEALVGCPAADAAMREFTSRWTDRLGELSEVTGLAARQADLTALSFRIAGG